MSLSFNFSTKTIHNGYLLTANIYGGLDTKTGLVWPSQNFPETFYSTREEVLAVCQNIMAWSIVLKPKAAVTKKQADQQAKKPAIKQEEQVK